MFRYFMRYFKMYFQTKNLPKVQLTDTTKFDLRVGISDLDYNMHVNNSAYLSALELARASFFLRSGLVSYAIKTKSSPIVASVHVVYTASLPPFANYFITSKVVGWDTKWIYMAQEVRMNKKPAKHSSSSPSSTTNQPSSSTSSENKHSAGNNHSLNHSHNHNHAHNRSHSHSHSHSRSHNHSHNSNHNSDSVLCAAAIVKGVLKSKNGTLHPHDILVALGQGDLPKTHMPAYIQEWANNEKHFKSWIHLESPTSSTSTKETQQ